jgi:plasmid maintenance system antidote protein VapI
MRHLLLKKINSRFGNKRGKYTLAAKKFGVTSVHIGLLVSGYRNPSWDLAEKMTAYFGVSSDRLFAITAVDDNAETGEGA